MWEGMVCPYDQGPLESYADWSCCRSCGRGFPWADGMPIILSEQEEAWRWQSAQRCRMQQLASPWHPINAPEMQLEQSYLLDALLRQHQYLSGPANMLRIGWRPGDDLPQDFVGRTYLIDPLAGVHLDRGLLNTPRIRPIVGLGERLPFASGFFQIILLGGVLDHSTRPSELLKEAVRCLAPGGGLWVIWRKSPFTWPWPFQTIPQQVATPFCRWSRSRFLTECHALGLKAQCQSGGKSLVAALANPPRHGVSRWLLRPRVWSILMQKPALGSVSKPPHFADARKLVDSGQEG